MLNFLTSSLLTFLPKPPILASCLFLEQTNFQPQAFGGSFQFPCGSAGKEFACNAGDLGLIPGLGDPLEKGKATHSSILAWRIPWTSPWGLRESDTTEWLSLSLSGVWSYLPSALWVTTPYPDHITNITFLWSSSSLSTRTKAASFSYTVPPSCFFFFSPFVVLVAICYCVVLILSS